MYCILAFLHDKTENLVDYIKKNKPKKRVYKELERPFYEAIWRFGLDLCVNMDMDS